MTFKPIKFRAAHGYDTDQASKEAEVNIEGPSLTIQSMAEDADINVLMERFRITQRFPDDPRPIMFGDFTDIVDYRTALDRLAEASDNFMRYPAQFRARFENDPQKFLEFCSDEKNRTEMQALGLLKDPPAGPNGPRGSTSPPVPEQPTAAPGAPPPAKT